MKRILCMVAGIAFLGMLVCSAENSYPVKQETFEQINHLWNDMSNYSLFLLGVYLSDIGTQKSSSLDALYKTIETTRDALLTLHAMLQVEFNQAQVYQFNPGAIDAIKRKITKIDSYYKKIIPLLRSQVDEVEDSTLKRYYQRTIDYLAQAESITQKITRELPKAEEKTPMRKEDNDRQ